MNPRLLFALCLPLLFATFSIQAAKPNAKATAALLEAAANGDEDDILAALAAGADPNARDAEKNTPLILTAPQSLFGKDRKIVEAFVAAKVQIDATNGDGITALMNAASGGRDGMVRLLLEYGAKVDRADTDGWTALMYAAAGGHWSAVKELIEAKATVDAASKKGWTPLGLALYNGRGSASEKLIAAGAKMPEKAPNGLNAILLAAYGRDLACVRQVLEAGQPTTGRDADGWSALALASAYGDGQIAMELLRAGADAASKDDEGRTALDRAKEFEHHELIAILGGPWTKPAVKGAALTIPCTPLGGNVEARFAIDSGALVVSTTYPKPLLYYIGGGNTNRAASAKQFTYEGSFTPSYYFDVDSNAKTGVKESMFKEANGSEYAIDYSQYGTSVTLEYRNADGEALSKSVYANVVSVDVEKEGESVDTSSVGDDAPRAINDQGVLVTRVPLSLLNLAAGKTIRVTGSIGSCGKPAVGKIKLTSD